MSADTTLTDAGNILFSSTVDGGYALTISNSGANVTFTDAVGAAAPLTGLTITTNVLSFDLGCYDYTYTGKEYIDKMYPNRHKLVIGNSTKTVPSFNKHNKSNKGTKDKYDVIFIDGGHTYPIPKIDLFNCKSLAHKDTIVIMDDTLFHHKQLQYTIGPTRTWFELTQNKLIEEIGHIDFSESRGMSWGKYK